MRTWIALALMAVTFTGCLEFEHYSDTRVYHRNLATQAAVETQTYRFDQSLPVSTSVGRERVGQPWALSLEPTVIGIDFELAWSEGVNGFGLEIETPGGPLEKFEPRDNLGSQDSVTGTIVHVDSGTYRFHVVQRGPSVPDDVRLRVEVQRRNNTPAAGSAELVRETDGSWVALLTYHARGNASETMRAILETANGDVRISGEGGQGASVSVTAWARADTQEAALARVKEIRVEARIESKDIIGMAHLKGAWEDRGAHIEAMVPPTTSLMGRGLTSNGGIELERLDVQGLLVETSNGKVGLDGVSGNTLQVHTSNGRIAGSAIVSHELELRTSNGGIDVSLEPAQSLHVNAETSNGRIDLRLAEGSSTAYVLQASTSNGHISETLEEADLEGNEDEATLRTRGGDGRPIQVTGTVSTSNGSIEFAAA